MPERDGEPLGGGDHLVDPAVGHRGPGVLEHAVDVGVVVGRVRELGVERENGPLLFYRGGYGQFH